MKLSAVVAIALAFIAASCSRRAHPLEIFDSVPHFELIAQDGRPFDSRALEGKIWVADFIFTTCPGPCPRMTSQMRKIQDATAKIPDVRFVSFTVDPAYDTPSVLAAYAKLHGASPAVWYFLTGAVPTLDALDRQTFKLGNVDGTRQHSTRFVLVDRAARIRGYYDIFEGGSISTLISDIRALERDNTAWTSIRYRP
jgi:protein SCO1